MSILFKSLPAEGKRNATKLFGPIHNFSWISKAILKLILELNCLESTYLTVNFSWLCNNVREADH